MGLDMYLTASKYVGNWEHSDKKDTKCYDTITSALGLKDFFCPGSPSLSVDVTVAYWRKANAIHKWFVQKIQEGVDNCQKCYVDRESLQELLADCQQVLAYKNQDDEKKVAMDTLPPQGGFFFGSTVIDQYYYDDIQNTIDQVQKILENPKLDDFDFYYQASW